MFEGSVFYTLDIKLQMHSKIYFILRFTSIDLYKIICQVVVSGWNGNNWYVWVFGIALLLLSNHALSNPKKYIPSGYYQAKDTKTTCEGFL